MSRVLKDRGPDDRLISFPFDNAGSTVLPKLSVHCHIGRILDKI